MLKSDLSVLLAVVVCATAASHHDNPDARTSHLIPVRPKFLCLDLPNGLEHASATYAAMFAGCYCLKQYVSFCGWSSSVHMPSSTLLFRRTFRTDKFAFIEDYGSAASSYLDNFGFAICLPHPCNSLSPMARLAVSRTIDNHRTWEIHPHSARSTCIWISAHISSASVHFSLHLSYYCGPIIFRMLELLGRHQPTRRDAVDSGTEPADPGTHPRGRVRRTSTHTDQIQHGSQFLFIRRTIHCPPFGDPQPSSEEPLFDEDTDIGDDLGKDEVSALLESIRLLSLILLIRTQSIALLSHPPKLQ